MRVFVVNEFYVALVQFIGVVFVGGTPWTPLKYRILPWSSEKYPLSKTSYLLVRVAWPRMSNANGPSFRMRHHLCLTSQSFFCSLTFSASELDSVSNSVVDTSLHVLRCPQLDSSLQSHSLTMFQALYRSSLDRSCFSQDLVQSQWVSDAQ